MLMQRTNMCMEENTHQVTIAMMLALAKHAAESVPRTLPQLFGSGMTNLGEYEN